MAIFKCKMCGGELDLQKGVNIAECSYCGTKQTVPTLDDKLIRLYNRANQYRLNSEFDKAYSAYEAIISEKNDEAEAYWGMVLSEFGVEYVEDPESKKRIPTCHRTLVKSISANENYKSALSFADVESQAMYEDEAEVIDSLQKKILNASAKEEPYDVFICYKETDPEGNRTEDSVLAQEIYDDLTNKGYRVFFSRITLEDKLGKDYEPCIYAALTSAKVMLVVTTDSDNCNAVWVKNEWKRYIDFMKTDKEKTLIPVYKNMSPYALPDEFAKLQAQDMSKLGAIQDLVRGVEKLVGKNDGGSKSGLSDDEKKLLNDFEKSQVKKKKRKRRIIGFILSLPLIFILGFIFIVVYTLVILPGVTYKDVVDVALIYNNVYVLKSDGTVDSFAGERKGWTDIVDITRADNYLLGVKKDGTVLSDSHGEIQEDIEGWTDIVSASVCNSYALGLKSDGTVVVAGNEDLSYILEDSWKDIVAVAAGESFAMGLKSNGKVIGYDLSSDCDADFSDWENIVAIDAGFDCAFGLKEDGTVVAVGDSAQCDVGAWTDIVAISVGTDHTVGLKSDGTVVSTIGMEGEGAVYDWTDIIAVYAGENYTVGLKSDGSLIDAGGEISDLVNFDDFFNYFRASASDIINNSNERIFNSNYEYAVDLMNNGDYAKAIKIFSHIINFKDSKEKIVECNKNIITKGKVGSVVCFGTFMSSEDGMLWRVLDVKNGKALVIAENVIENRPFYVKEQESLSWETSDIRKWLNGEFLDNSFTEEEKALIPTVTVLGDDGTNSTEDKIFLLSEKEVLKYFSSDAERICYVSRDIKENDVIMDNGKSSWWLRSIDDFFEDCESVATDGDISGNNSADWDNGIRPAMWIEIN